MWIRSRSVSPGGSSEASDMKVRAYWIGTSTMDTFLVVAAAAAELKEVTERMRLDDRTPEPLQSSFNSYIISQPDRFSIIISQCSRKYNWNIFTFRHHIGTLIDSTRNLHEGRSTQLLRNRRALDINAAEIPVLLTSPSSRQFESTKMEVSSILMRLVSWISLSQSTSNLQMKSKPW